MINLQLKYEFLLFILLIINFTSLICNILL